MAPTPPSVPEAALEARGWRRTDDRIETVFEGLGVAVESRTLVYEDRELRSRVVDAGGPDRVWRFLFVARLEITPKPMFGGHAALRPRVLREAKQTFATELRERGIEAVSAGNDERTEVGGDRRARLVPYRGKLPIGDDDDEKSAVDIVGRLALWYDDGFYLAGVAGPSGTIDGWAEAETDAGELLAFAVG
jgi:hypothetical protein